MIHNMLGIVAKKKASTGIYKTVVFDIADNHGDSTWLAVRSIEFLKDSSVISMPASKFTAYATAQFSASFDVDYVFDTTLSKTGAQSGNQWTEDQSTNMRLIIVFNTPQDFDEIVVNNGHVSGVSTNRGAQNVKISYTESEYTNTTYNAAITGGVELNNTAWSEHPATDTVDDQTVWTAP